MSVPCLLIPELFEVCKLDHLNHQSYGSFSISHIFTVESTVLDQFLVPNFFQYLCVKTGALISGFHALKCPYFQVAPCPNKIIAGTLYYLFLVSATCTMFISVHYWVCLLIAMQCIRNSYSYELGWYMVVTRNMYCYPSMSLMTRADQLLAVFLWAVWKNCH